MTSLNRRRKSYKSLARVGLLMTTADHPSVLTEERCAKLEWTSQTAVHFSRGENRWASIWMDLNCMNFVYFACKQMASLSDCSRILMHSPPIPIYKMLLPWGEDAISSVFVTNNLLICRARLLHHINETFWIYSVGPPYHYFSGGAMYTRDVGIIWYI